MKNIFISCYGGVSRNVATKLENLIHMIFQEKVSVSLSCQSNKLESKWITETVDKFDQTNFGIICLTKDNVFSPTAVRL